MTGALDVAAVLKRRDYWVSEWSDAGAVGWLESVGIELERGHGRLDGERRVIVERDGAEPLTLIARHAVAVSPGSDPVIPSTPGLADARPWTSRDATSVQHPPRRLAILGGGVTAVEMATAYAGFGTEVTVLARSSLLRNMEPFAGDAVLAGLRGLGASVRLGASVTRVDRNSADEVIVELDDGSTVTADEVLVATGRRPRTDALGVESVGLEPGDWIGVDDTMLATGATGNGDRPWLYAVGDVNHRALLTHQGKYQARATGDLIAARALGLPVDTAPWGAHVATADHSAVPEVVFAEPECVSVGLTAAAAERSGRTVRVADVELGGVSGAGILADGYEGHARLVVDARADHRAGATFVGQDVAELLHAATIAIVGEVTVDRLWHAVPAFPTVSEAWLRLLEALGRPGSLATQVASADRSDDPVTDDPSVTAGEGEAAA